MAHLHLSESFNLLYAICNILLWLIVSLEYYFLSTKSPHLKIVSLLILVQLLFREDATVDDLIDVIEGNRKYMKCIYVYNKIDVIGIDDVDKLARQPNSVVISCNLKVGFMLLIYALSFEWFECGTLEQPYQFLWFLPAAGILSGSVNFLLVKCVFAPTLSNTWKTHVTTHLMHTQTYDIMSS